MSEAEQALSGLVVKWWRAYLAAEDRIAAARAVCLDVELRTPTGTGRPAVASEAYGLAADVLDALGRDYVTDDDVEGDDRD